MPGLATEGWLLKANCKNRHMNIKGIINLSLIGLKTNKNRSFLTMLGIIIGIAAVIIIMSVGSGAQSLIVSQVQKVGSNLLGIMPGGSDEEGPPASAFGITVTTLTYEDGLAITRQIPEIVAAASLEEASTVPASALPSFDRA